MTSRSTPTGPEKATVTMHDHPFTTDFAEMSRHGETARGGVHREAGTAADRATRAWFAEWLADRGFEVRYDEIGNQFGLRTLAEGAPYVLVGSHLDSQPMGGRFDGAYGVLAGAYAADDVARRVGEGALEATFNLAVVNWFNEEGSRFTPSMMGSSVHTGRLEAEKALATSDRAGVTVRQELEAEGTDRTFSMPPVASYAEIHIEQGRILEDAGATIGLVTNTWAAKKFQVTVTGAQAHTGSTIMADRRDALYGAARVIVAAREVTDRVDAGALHSSVSELTLEPNSPVTLAREVVLNLDLRSPDARVIADAERMLEESFAQIEQDARVSIVKTPTHEWDQLAYSSEGVELARAVAEDLGLSHREIMTVAGHDSTNMKDVVPTVMVFVPSIEGISHNEAEDTEDADAIAGVRMLTEVMGRLVGGALTGDRAGHGS